MTKILLVYNKLDTSYVCILDGMLEESIIQSILCARVGWGGCWAFANTGGICTGMSGWHLRPSLLAIWWCVDSCRFVLGEMQHVQPSKLRTTPSGCSRSFLWRVSRLDQERGSIGVSWIPRSPLPLSQVINNLIKIRSLAI